MADKRYIHNILVLSSTKVIIFLFSPIISCGAGPHKSEWIYSSLSLENFQPLGKFPLCCLDMTHSSQNGISFICSFPRVPDEARDFMAFFPGCPNLRCHIHVTLSVGSEFSTYPPSWLLLIPYSIYRPETFLIVITILVRSAVQ